MNFTCKILNAKHPWGEKSTTGTHLCRKIFFYKNGFSHANTKIYNLYVHVVSQLSSVISASRKLFHNTGHIHGIGSLI
jgi:hypothetical protein